MIGFLSFLACLFCSQAIAGDSPAAKENAALSRYKAGTVQQVHVGYSPDLARCVQNSVDKLRNKPLAGNK
jgi:hypothetical protein